MTYKVSSSEKLRPIGAETETKALLYLMNFSENRNEIYYFVIDFFNDVTGMSSSGSKIWDLQSKGKKNSTPKEIGRELVTLFKNYESEFQFDGVILFLDSVSSTVRVDGKQNVFTIDNITKTAKLSIIEGLKEEANKKQYINNSSITEASIDSFLNSIVFVVNDKSKADYIREIIVNHPKIVPNDNLLNSIFEELKKISDYDFDSDLNVNILGHIFEQSISDIEELKKSISGEEFDQKKSKRKKDGIFYPPQYITKYIVENSIKNWLDDKRKELGEDDLPKLNEKDYIFDIAKKNYTKNYRKHIEFWQQYREAVRNIKIIDPACGSGAFLITAFEFLLNYNKYLDDKIFDLVGTSDLFSDRTKEILQNNIFGVDLNRESVEITKLSLWLKTADKNKTLASLENNIKCGNSLIDEPEIAGNLAFNWEKEFPEIFANGGFDIVVGNPPYVLCQPSNTNEKTLKFYNNFEVSSYKIDLYHLFFEKGIILSKNNGYISFITPNTYLVNKYNLKLREFILRNTQIKEIINYKNRDRRK